MQTKILCLHILTIRKLIDLQVEETREDDSCVIKELDMEVKKGELIGVMGPVGSGKTALFNTLLGEMRFDPNCR